MSLLLLAPCAFAWDLTAGCPPLQDTVDAHALWQSPPELPVDYGDLVALVETQTLGGGCTGTSCVWADGSSWAVSGNETLGTISVAYTTTEADRWGYGGLEGTANTTDQHTWYASWTGRPFEALPRSSAMGRIDWSYDYYGRTWHHYYSAGAWLGDCNVAIGGDLPPGDWPAELVSVNRAERLVRVEVDHGFCEAGGDRVYGGLDGDEAVLLSELDWAPSGEEDADQDNWPARCGDCDDGNAAVYPNTIYAQWWGPDVDCDGAYADDDCGPEDPTAYPGATEVLHDGVDQDCNGRDDVDDDGDGHDPAVDDCDDTDPTIHHGAREVPNNGIDEDCSGHDLVDEDGDGYDAWTSDCDDADPAVNPRADEVPNNGIDEDCSGHDWADEDGDGYDAWTDDCDDTDPTANPEGDEIACDDVDQDCNGADLCTAHPPEDSDTAAPPSEDPPHHGCTTAPQSAAPRTLPAPVLGVALLALVTRRRRPREEGREESAAGPHRRCTSRSPMFPPSSRTWLPT